MLLQTINACKYFGGIKAVEGVTCQLHAGQIKSVIGPNGAGKTTFFNLIAGLFRPTSGKIIFHGRDISGRSIHEMARCGITKTYQITHVFPNLTVFENVRIAAQSKATQFNFWGKPYHYEKASLLAFDILENIGLIKSQGRLASELSHGEKRYLEIGIALATQPELLLLDEPTAGMSPSETIEAKGFIRKIHESLKLTIMLIEHDMSVVMDISDSILVLHEGKVLAEGTPGEISASRDVQAVYLGGRRDA
jgi:branched-chain amino acid transport system ATP-binding protein